MHAVPHARIRGPQASDDEAELTTNLFFGSGEGDHALEVIHGAWPDDLEGFAFIIGPNKHRPADHWFAGDGLVCRIALTRNGQGRIEVKTRAIGSPARALRRLAPWLFRRIGGMLEVSPLGFTNYGNTNLQPLGDRLFVGYDAGRPLELCPVTLEVVGGVGRIDDFVPSLPGLIDPLIVVAAHPGVDHVEHTLYFVNYIAQPKAAAQARLLRVDPNGRVERFELEPLGKFDTIHDVKVTEHHVVFSDLAFVQGRGKNGARRPNQAHTCVWIVRKKDLVAGRRVPVKKVLIDLPTGHLSVAYRSEREDELTVFLQHSPATDLPLALGPDDVRFLDPTRGYDPGHYGLASLGAQPAVLGRYRIDVERGEVLERTVAFTRDGVWGATLATGNEELDSSRDRPKNLFWSGAGLDPRMLSRRYVELYRDHAALVVPFAELLEMRAPPALQRFDLTEMRVADVAFFAPGSLPLPPTFVPRKNPQHDLDGYVLVLVHRDGDKTLELFDAAHLTEGPIAVVSAKGFCPPLLLHSCFMRSLSPQAKRSTSELRSRLAAQRTWLRHVAMSIARARK